jgi:CheY-like chemotaxis protein
MPPRILLAGFPEEVSSWLGSRMPDVVVTSAATGAAALAILESGRWAAAVLHAKLAGPPLLEVVAGIREDPKPDRLPLLVCLDQESSRRPPEDLLRRIGVTRVLLHPLDREALARELAVLLGVGLLPAAPAGVSGVLAQIWERFRGLMFDRLAAIEAAAVAALEGGLEEALRRQGEREAHKLVGALGTFGLAEGSCVAREIEQLLKGTSPLARAQILRLSDLAVALRRILEEQRSASG